jgi:hypothetical protein
MKSNALPFAMLALAAGFVLTRKERAPEGLLPGGPVELVQGGRYLFIVRLSASDAAAEAVLTPKGVEELNFSPATNPPPWTAEGEPYSARVASFRFTAKGRSTVELGQDFYGIGRLEKVVPL